LLAAANLKAYAYENGDFQIWHTEAQEFELTNKWSMPIEEEWRYGNDAAELYYQHYEAGIAYDINKYFTVTGNYRQVWEGERGKLRPEYRPYIQAIPKLDIWVFKFEDRNRLEYRLFDYKDDILRYRNKVSVKLPLEFHGFEFAPYVANEIFVDINEAIMRKNRFSTGIILNVVKGLKGEVYYMLQSTKKSGRWTGANILGLRLKVSF